MAQAPDDPDWSIWSKADAIDLRDAVALSIDIGPGGQRHGYAKSGGKLDRPSDPKPDHYHERLTLSLSHLGRELPLAEPRLPTGVPPETNKVRLVDFAAFASRMGWDLSDRFPWKELVYTDENGNEVTLVNVDGKQMARTPAGGYVTHEQWHAMTHPPHEPIPPEVVIETSMQEARSSNVPVVRLVQTSKPKPDWETWGNVPEASIIQVVAISCNIEPGALKPGELGENPSSELHQYWKRLTIASANAVSGTLKCVRTNPGTGLLPPRIFDDVSLAEFAAWAQSLRYPWELPENFPKSKNEGPAKPAEVVATKPAQLPQPGGTATTLDKTTIDLAKNTRETLLTIIAILAGDEKLLNPGSTAAKIERQLEKLGIPKPKKRMILNHLKAAKQVLDSRKAKDG